MNSPDPNPDRRSFLRTSLAAAALGASFKSPLKGATRVERSQITPLKLLILGGTAFLGPHLVESAQARGHQITLFNRGKTNTQLFPELEKFVGDRDPNKGDGLKALEKAVADGRKWDAVIDTSAYYPRVVTSAAEALKGAVGHYQFISTLSVFADRSVDVDEGAPVVELEDPATEKVTGATYGGLKALCEAAAEAAMPGQVSNVRPGLIVGPLDRSDRFTWWPQRIARGGEVLAPGKPDAPIQVIDVRDLAQWCIHLIENQTAGVLNAVGPGSRVTMQEFLHGCKIVLGADASFTWIADDFLLEQKVRPYTQMPLWIPREGAPYGTAQCQKAMAAGLSFRPLGDTIRDTLAWSQTRDSDHRWRAGLAAEREAQIIAAWAKKKDE
jgi:2'-hydroxyisoflavone reductase